MVIIDFLILLLMGIMGSSVVFACKNYLTHSLKKEIASYQPIVNKIFKETLKGQFKSTTYRELAHFVDKFQYRLPGTKNMENSIDYMLQRSKKKKLENVHGEPVPVQAWLR
ncbi:hypothetical protein HHI36_012709 [Cryptolaemus montrouzieri]|uniref:Uncharacterized protein n=1 Tax=Cryptolaemus montrouzieri TaxID=559131 RepID=A0ABD2NFL2_9CUCU